MRGEGLRVCFFICFVLMLAACRGPMVQDKVSQLESASRLDWDAQYFVMSDGYRLPFRKKLPDQPKALVLALHGFNDYSKAFDLMCAALFHRGSACIAYDQRGFGQTDEAGLWPGKGVLESDLTEVLSLLRGRFGDLPIYLVGESMGGAVIMSSAEDHSTQLEQVAGIALLAPAVWARHTQPWYQRTLLWLAVHTVPAWKPTGEGLGIRATDNIDALREMSKDPLVIKATRIDAIYGLNNLMDKALGATESLPANTVIFYGQKDEVIPHYPTCEMLKSIDFEGQADVQFRLYEEGFHMLSRDKQRWRLFDEMASWIADKESVHFTSQANKQVLCDESAG